ncbi:hypothetical protein [Shewanella sp.]|uniref:hypothetical protein n=1 Tax=Shewanella sp. TaxID=50422 RepID=UPI003A8353AB
MEQITKPNYDSAIVGTAGKSKLYQTSRVIDVFNLTHDVVGDAFSNCLMKFGKTVTDKEINIAQQAYDNLLVEIEKKKQADYDRFLVLDLIHSYKISLIDIRDCVINTNNGKAFLLPENHKLVGRYHSQSDVLSSVNDQAFTDMIKAHCLPYDSFVLEPVSRLNVERLIEPEDLELDLEE